MRGEYYTLPIPFKNILERKEIAKCDLQTSIAQKIHLLLVSFFGENRYNPDFGCLVWEYDFENIYNLSGWKDNVIQSLAATLTDTEKRLSNIYVNMDVVQEEFGNGKGQQMKSIRKRLDVQVQGYLQKTNERFSFSETIYISPISLD
jgi:phage baseplate assembly protein W